MNNDVRRFGVIAPPGNVAIERELPPVLPPGVAMNHNRLSRPGSGATTSDSLLGMADSIDRASRDLAEAKPEVILYGCTSGSFLFGPGREAEAARRIFDVTGIAAITTSMAVISALRAFAAREVFMVGPYPDNVIAEEIEFLAHYGVKVRAWDSFRCGSSENNRKVSSEQVAEMVLAHVAEASDCDAVFITCTNLLSMDRIAYLEDRLGKPVTTSNQASLWAALRAMDVDTSAIASGSLFTRRAAVEVIR